LKTKGSRRRQRGSILLHVMVTGVVVSIVAAAILRMTMLRYRLAYRSAVVTQEKRSDTAALNILITTWNSTGGYCQNAGMYTCGPAQAAPMTSCGCTCTTGTAGYPPSITGGGALPNCTLSITSPDLMMP
jgi:hypothetical protein